MHILPTIILWYIIFDESIHLKHMLMISHNNHMMKGGGIKSAPFNLRLLLLATVLSTALLLTAYVLLKSSKKPICNVSVYGGSNDKHKKSVTDSKLDQMCGHLVKVNTLKDIPFVFLCAGFGIAAFCWLACVLNVLKSKWWNCTLRGDCSSISEIYYYYSIFGAIVMLFFLPGFIDVAKKTQRTCKGSPISNCRMKSFNDGSLSLILFAIILFFVIALILLMVLLFYNSNEA